MEKYIIGTDPLEKLSNELNNISKPGMWDCFVDNKSNIHYVDRETNIGIIQLFPSLNPNRIKGIKS